MSLEHQTPDVSVVVCVYNEEIHLETCLRSLTRQRFDRSYEIVVVNDASNDNSATILKKFEDSPVIRVLHNGSRRGIGYSAHVGVLSSAGRYIVRVDADDYVSEYLLQVLFLALNEGGGHSAVRCDYLKVDNAGRSLGAVNAREFPIACGVMFDRDALVQVGLYNPDLEVGEDTDLEQRFSSTFEISHVAIPLYRYRQHPGNTTRSLEGPIPT